MQELISQIEEMGIEINHTNSLIIIFGIIFLTAIIVHLILHRVVLRAFEKRAQASSHFVVGIEGEVVQCIPTSEWSYASNQRNFDTISIECCHPDDSGEFTDETYNSVVQLAGFLCKRFNLTSDDVIRHYDVTEKLCPLYYVEHEDAWIQMKADIQAYADSLS